MNILRLVTYSTDIKFTPSQLDQCNKNKDAECFAYINPNAIGVTTCGTRINALNVFPQKRTHSVKMAIYEHSSVVEVHGEIDNQQVVALTSRDLIEKQQLYANCKNIIKKEDRVVWYEDCKHIKFVVNSEDIVIAK